MSDDEDLREEASPLSTEIQDDGDARDENQEADFYPFSEIDEDFKPGPAKRVMGPDGLPETVDTTSETDIPSLSTETLVCMGDYSSFVVRNEWREITLRFSAEDVERAPDGRWRISRKVAVERSKAAIEAERQAYREREKEARFIDRASDDDVFGWLLGQHGRGQGRDQFIVVEPVRPPCRHYVRQKSDFYLNASHRIYSRLCSARRTTEGTFMTVRDTGMYACDMRDPVDLESLKALDEFDRMKVEQGREAVHLPMFGGPGGIFGSKKGAS